MVPEEWTKAAIKEFGHVSAGRQRSPNFTEGVVRPYLRVANVYEAFIDTSDINEMPFTDKEFERYKLEPGDILLNEGQSTELVGRPAMYQGEPANCCFQNTLVRFKAGDRVNANYALQRFLQCLYDGTFQSISKKTTSIAHLGVSRFADLKLAWPPLPEQKKIAQILSTWDKAITTTEQLLANSQQQKKSLIQQLLTGKKRLLDENGVRFEGEWDSINLGQVLDKVSNGVTYDANNVEGLPVTRIETISTGKVNFNKVGYAPDEEKTRRFQLHRGDILYSHINSLEHIGRVAYFNDIRPLFHGMNLLLLRTGEENSSLYIYYLLDSQLGKKYAKSYAKSAVNQASISSTDVKTFRFRIPKLSEQKKIADVLRTVDLEISALQQELDALKQEKKALMQQLLTGKRRVKVQ
jgi:type I restriction enzyme S subunit